MSLTRINRQYANNTHPLSRDETLCNFMNFYKLNLQRQQVALISLTWIFPILSVSGSKNGRFEFILKDKSTKRTEIYHNFNTKTRIYHSLLVGNTYSLVWCFSKSVIRFLFSFLEMEDGEGEAVLAVCFCLRFLYRNISGFALKFE